MRRILIGLLSLVLLTLFLTGVVHASKLNKGLTISPIRSELEVAPGTALNGSLSVTNSTNSSMVVDLDAEEFSVINQQYDYAFTAESDVAKWVTFSNSKINLGSGETQKVTFTVSAPLLTEPGGRYVSMFASTNTPSGSGILSKQRLASLLYINVTGDVTRLGKLVSLTSPWFISSESSWGITIQNKGSTHFRSRYSLEISDILGGKVSDMNNESLILPNTVRLLVNKVPTPVWPGIYIANYNIGLGDTPAVRSSRLVIYSPLWFTVILTALFAIVLVRILNRRKSRQAS